MKGDFKRWGPFSAGRRKSLRPPPERAFFLLTILTRFSKELRDPSLTFAGFDGSGTSRRTVAELVLLTSVERINTSSVPFHATIALCPVSSRRTSGGQGTIPESALLRE